MLVLPHSENLRSNTTLQHRQRFTTAHRRIFLTLPGQQGALG